MENRTWIYFAVLENLCNLSLWFSLNFWRLLVCLISVLQVLSWYLWGLELLEGRATTVTVGLPPMGILPTLLWTVRMLSSWLSLGGLEQALSVILPGVKCCDIALEGCLNIPIHSAAVPVERKIWKKKHTLGTFQKGRVIRGTVTCKHRLQKQCLLLHSVNASFPF